MSKFQLGMQAIAGEPANKPILKRFFRFALAMVAVPLFSYGITHSLMRAAVANGFLYPRPFASPSIVGGLVAVLSINVIAGIFALCALRESAVADRAVGLEDIVQVNQRARATLPSARFPQSKEE